MKSAQRLGLADLRLIFLTPTGPLVLNLMIDLVVGLVAIVLVASGLARRTLILPSGAFLGVFGPAGVTYALRRRRNPRFSRWCGIIANVAFVAAIARDFVAASNGWGERFALSVLALYFFVLPTVFLIQDRNWFPAHDA